MSKNAKTLHLFRHGETEWNVLRRLQGHTDIPLNEQGQNQALELQKYFDKHPVDLFVSSDLLRAQQTAEIANFHLKRPLKISSDLREAFMGELEGLTREDAHVKFGEDAWGKWSSVLPAHRDFAFPGAESSAKTIARTSSALARICQEMDFKSVGICTHGLVIRRFLHYLKPEMTDVLPVPNCSVYKLEWEPESQKFYFIS